MKSLQRNIVIALALAGSLPALKASSIYYSVTMGIHDTLKITLDCHEAYDHIWKLDGLENQSVIKLSNKTTGKDADRVYDPSSGHKKYATSSTLKRIAQLPFGYTDLLPYQQEYFFYATTKGTTYVTFSCPALPAVTVEITVINKHKTKNHTLHIKS